MDTRRIIIIANIAAPCWDVADSLPRTGHFHQDGVGFDYNTGFTFDGHMLNYTRCRAAPPLAAHRRSGELLPGGLHNFSAASKESLHVAMLVLALTGSPLGARFVTAAANTSNPNATAGVARGAMHTPHAGSCGGSAGAQDGHVRALQRIVPGFWRCGMRRARPGSCDAGFLPWVTIDADGVAPIAPSWSNQVPALDNGAPAHVCMRC